GFLFELMDDYYPGPNTGFVVCDQNGRVLATGRGIFELTGFDEKQLLGRDVAEGLGFSDRTPVALALEWGVRRLGEQLELTTRAARRADRRITSAPERFASSSSRPMPCSTAQRRASSSTCSTANSKRTSRAPGRSESRRLSRARSRWCTWCRERMATAPSKGTGAWYSSSVPRTNGSPSGASGSSPVTSKPLPASSRVRLPLPQPTSS